MRFYVMRSVPHDAGVREVITIASPFAGADFQYLLPNNFRYRLDMVHYQLVTDANVANRYPGLRITETGLYDSYLHGLAAITASLSVNISMWPGLSAIGAITASYYTMSLPRGLYLSPQTNIYSHVAQIQAADQLNNIYLYFTKWPDDSV
jgi:hypothetical protein